MCNVCSYKNIFLPGLGCLTTAHTWVPNSEDKHVFSQNPAETPYAHDKIDVGNYFGLL